MRQQIIESGGGVDYDWTNDHICVKTSCDYADGRVTVVEDTRKPGFHLVRHFHKKMTEIFYILDCKVTFNFDDESVAATCGTTVNV